MSEASAEKCKHCGRAAVYRKYNWPPGPLCVICDLACRYASAPPRSAPGNISDWEIRNWMETKLRAAFEEMLSMMRADLDALSKKWNPPVEQLEKHPSS